LVNNYDVPESDGTRGDKRPFNGAIDPKQTVTNDSYPAVKATADSGSLRAET